MISTVHTTPMPDTLRPVAAPGQPKLHPTAHRPAPATNVAGLATRVHRAALVCGMLVLTLAN